MPSTLFRPISWYKNFNKMEVNPHLILWIRSFLTDRPQYVCTGKTKSKTRITNTGAPQGCVLSPVLFALYTNDLRSNQPNCDFIKYADDTAIVGRISKQSHQAHMLILSVSLCFWTGCENHFLTINASKTKEIVFDFGKSSVLYPPVAINNENINVVDEYHILEQLLTAS